MFSHLAQGLIFKASPRLIQKPAPPVANQKLTGLCNGETKTSASVLNTPHIYNQCICRFRIFWKTYHLVVPKSFCGFNWPVQAGFANVHILSVRVVGQQLHQCLHIHIVIIIHMTEPPKPGRDIVRKSNMVCTSTHNVTIIIQCLLFSGLNELVVLNCHLAGQSLAAVGSRAVGVDDMASCLDKKMDTLSVFMLNSTYVYHLRSGHYLIGQVTLHVPYYHLPPNSPAPVS